MELKLGKYGILAKKYLEEYKPFWFQKKKLKAHYEDINLLEDKICDYYRQINKEVEMINKMKDALKK